MRAIDTTASAASAEAFTSRGDLLATMSVDAVSDVGARLRIERSARLPDQFMLKFDENRIFAATVRWRLSGSIGVYFPERCAKIYKPEADLRTVALMREIEALKRDLALHKAMSSV